MLEEDQPGKQQRNNRAQNRNAHRNPQRRLSLDNSSTRAIAEAPENISYELIALNIARNPIILAAV